MSRFDYVKYDEKSEALQDAVKSHIMMMEMFLEELLPSREKSLAITKIEEAYMWVGKAIRNDQIVRNGSAELQKGRKD